LSIIRAYRGSVRGHDTSKKNSKQDQKSQSNKRKESGSIPSSSWEVRCRDNLILSGEHVPRKKKRNQGSVEADPTDGWGNGIRVTHNELEGVAKRHRGREGKKKGEEVRVSDYIKTQSIGKRKKGSSSSGGRRAVREGGGRGVRGGTCSTKTGKPPMEPMVRGSEGLNSHPEGRGFQREK